MKLLVKFSLLAIGVLFTFTSMAANPRYTSCSYRSNWCLFRGMPHMNQNDWKLRYLWANPRKSNSSMLCAPTAGLMGISANANKSWSLKRRSFVSKVEQKKSYYSQVKRVVNLMNTNFKKGTRRGGIDNYIHVKNSFRRWSYSYKWGNRSHKFKYKKALRKSLVPIVHYGHYKKKTKRYWGTRVTTYKRKGGHVVAVRGINKRHDSVFIYDPWYKAKYTSGFNHGRRGWKYLWPFSKVETLSRKSTGNQRKVIEGVYAVRGY